MGLALIVGRLITGLLLDRMQATYVFAVAILLLLMSCLCARVIAGNMLIGILVAVLLGLGSGGTSSTLAYMTGRYFGLRAYASIFGILMGVFALGYGTAPALAGHVRDVLDSYTPMFSYLGVGAGVAMVLALTLGRVALPVPQPSVPVLRKA
jgi:MFS family permease